MLSFQQSGVIILVLLWSSLFIVLWLTQKTALSLFGFASTQPGDRTVLCLIRTPTVLTGDSLTKFVKAVNRGFTYFVKIIFRAKECGVLHRGLRLNREGHLGEMSVFPTPNRRVILDESR